MRPKLPPSDEVIAEHIARCPCPACEVHRIVDDVMGWPDEDRALFLVAMTVLVRRLSDSFGGEE